MTSRRPFARGARSGSIGTALLLSLLAVAAQAQPRFPGPWYPSGPQTRSFVAVDFDGDGLLDAVTANAEGGSSLAGDFRLLRGNPDGSFRAAEVLASTDVFAGALAVADLDGDAIPDLVATLPILDQVVVYRGTGDGGIQPPVSSFAGDGCRRLAVGDLNGDGAPDVVTGNSVSDTLSILIGNGDGSLQPPTELPFPDYPSILSGGVSPRSVDLSDVDLDGDLDVVVATWPLGVNLFTGNGDGTFEPGIPVLGQDRDSDSAKLADMDGDAVPDLVTIGAGLGDVLRVFHGGGDGTFGPPIPYPTGDTPQNLVVADLDGDEHLDVVLSNYSSQSIQTWLGNGDGTLRSTVGESPATPSTHLAVADLDRDGTPDLVQSIGLGFIGVQLGNGDGTFQLRRAAPVGAAPEAMASADLNRDGVPDAVTVNDESSDVTVVLGNGDGTFAPPLSHPLTVPPYSDLFSPPRLALGDLDGDEIDDLVVARPAVPETSVLLGVGDGTFLPASPVDAGPYPVSVAIGDFDADGIADLAAANQLYGDDRRLVVALGNGDGTFQPALRLPLVSQPTWVAAVDVDSDGAVDLVTVETNHPSASTLSVTRGNGDGTFQPTASMATQAFPVFVTAADLNGDAVPDLVSTHFSYSDEASENDIVVHLGRGDGSFESFAPISSGRWAGFVDPADIDGDGHLDLVVANVIDDSVSVHLGRGDGTFERPSYYAAGDAPFSLAVTDANGDGRLDILTSNRGTDSVSTLLNGGEPAARLCDADGNGAVDRLDLGRIFRSLRQRVEPGDPRDPDGDGRVTLRDARQCRGECDLPGCRIVPACGLLGVEPLLLLACLGWRRRLARAAC